MFAYNKKKGEIANERHYYEIYGALQQCGFDLSCQGWEHHKTSCESDQSLQRHVSSVLFYKAGKANVLL